MHRIDAEPIYTIRMHHPARRYTWLPIISLHSERKTMGIVWTIVLGFVIGLFAKFLHPARRTWASS
jgi:uncharacterized membrane protein YczE